MTWLSQARMLHHKSSQLCSLKNMSVPLTAQVARRMLLIYWPSQSIITFGNACPSESLQRELRAMAKVSPKSWQWWSQVRALRLCKTMCPVTKCSVTSTKHNSLMPATRKRKPTIIVHRLSKRSIWSMVVPTSPIQWVPLATVAPSRTTSKTTLLRKTRHATTTTSQHRRSDWQKRRPLTPTTACLLRSIPWRMHYLTWEAPQRQNALLTECLHSLNAA